MRHQFRRPCRLPERAARQISRPHRLDVQQRRAIHRIQSFDTCVYHQPGIDLLTKVIPVDDILFASEMIGALRGIDPETGNYYDDTKRYIEAAALSAEDRYADYEARALSFLQHDSMQAMAEKVLAQAPASFALAGHSMSPAAWSRVRSTWRSATSPT
jgi:hypothetical protein